MNMITLPRPETTGKDYFDLHTALAALEEGTPLTFPPFELVQARIDGVAVTFCLNMLRDPIQNCHRRGAFYESRELSKLRQMLPTGAAVLDVGANVGNHALYFAQHMAASRVVVIEPNPLALAPLVANVVINRLTDVIDLGALGVGLAAGSEAGLAMRRHARNLGATKMRRTGAGRFEVHAGDDLFVQDHFDLIKIDTEGMEIDVLAGLENTITRCRPVMLIEVGEDNATGFADWVAAHDYAIADQVRHRKANCNYLLRPAEAAAQPTETDG